MTRFIIFVVLYLLSLPVFADAASRYIRLDARNESVVIFVHGVTGNSISTWTNPTTKAYWPSLLVLDKDFGGENIFLYEYPSPKIDRSYNINELAEDMRLTLNNNVIARHKRVIFLAHSMGGLIVRQFLLKYPDSVPKVGFMYFYATPTTGSPMALLASQLSRNPQMGNLRPMRSDEYLGNLQRDWLASLPHRSIPSFCAYEIQKLYTARVVEQESASNLCNRPLDPIDANHINIVKPASSDDKIYRAFEEAYSEMRKTTGVLGLRAQIQNLAQAIGTKTALGVVSANNIFCDSVRFTLVLANDSKTMPILINSIFVNARKISQAGNVSCQTDRFSSIPYGIIEKNVFMVDVKEGGIKSRYLKNKNEVVTVDKKNILLSQDASRAIAIKTGEEPIGLDFLVHSFAKDPHEISFTIEYDQNGQRNLTTQQIVIRR